MDKNTGFSGTHSKRNEDTSCSLLSTPPSFDETLERVEECDFFFGFLSEDDCKDFLLVEGDFLLRCSKDSSSPQDLIWTIAVKDHKNMVQQIPVRRDDQGRYLLMERKFSSIITLVNHFNMSRELIGLHVPAVLRRVAAKPKWLLSNNAITKFARIGHGQGGSVWAGTLNSNCHLGKRQIAIKLLVEDAKPEQIASFEREVRIHRQLSHHNIVQFIAIVIDKSPIRLVTELCDYNLKIHLKKNASKLTINDKTQICLEVSEGLEYLVDKGFIHRDIAARNCLMKRGHVRITDLGLAVRLVGAKVAFAEAEKLPIKTTAPEGLICSEFASYTLNELAESKRNLLRGPYSLLVENFALRSPANAYFKSPAS